MFFGGCQQPCQRELILGCLRNPTYSDIPLRILQGNVQCIRNKLLEVEQVCESQGIDLFCVSEHWLVEREVDLYVPSGYFPASYYCRNIKKLRCWYSDQKWHKF